MSKDNKKDIEYQIVKSEACGHTIQYKMIKKEGRCWDGYEPTPGKEPYSKGSCKPIKKDEHDLEKAKVDEGLSSREKMKAREERSPKERAPKELNPDQYETAKKIARTKAIGEKERKQTLKDALHTHKMKPKDKLPSKEDLEYPMAASEKECLCKDCDCDKKEVKKSEKFYIQKIQELRKQQPSLPGMETGMEKLRNNISQYKNQASSAMSGLKNRAMDMARGVNTQASLPGMETGKEKIMSAMRSAPSKIADVASKTPAASRAAFSSVGNLATKALPYASKAAGIASALYPEQIGQSTEDKNFVEQQMARSKASRVSPEATQNVANLLSNKQPVSQAAPNMSMPGQAPTAPTTPTAPAPQSFGEAFKAARAARMGGQGSDVFEFGGKKYHSFSKDDFSQGLGSKYNPAAKQSAQAPAESIKSTPATPNIENAPSANPMKGEDLGSTKLRPEENMGLKNQA